MEARRYTFSLILPVCNEEKTLQELFLRLEKVMGGLGKSYEVICVDDGSTDRSFTILEEKAEHNRDYKVIKLSRNFGHQIAVTAGIDAAEGEAVIILDADLQDPPEFIPELIAKWKEGYDVVYAIRNKRTGSFLRKIAIKATYRFINKITRIKIPVDAGEFRLMSRRVVDALRKDIRERSRYLRGLSCWVGFRQVGIEYEREERFAGETKYPFWGLARLAVAGITSFSNFPLQLAAYLGFIVSFLSVIMIIRLLIQKFSGMEIEGWVSVMVSIFFMGGVQLFTLGVFGEYIGRIYEEVKQRPMYIVERKINL